ncbi:FtsX-like permease family protein [Pseudoflavitalea sp. X16]|uniref:FtsX-like permease family protein n=1 Tax=Paraflavitalea devenefica TaxID=2716334 RepID=UPI00141E52CF|nr:FtsX-like permease family protein [Paraflavitalea devenefica]NII27669.1 FtsX-like permease family protein [Paraflavitalea devenefica]
MTSPFLKTAVRSLRKNKSFTLINVAGLGVGIAASLLIFLVIHHELSYDGYQTYKDRIYRVVVDKKNRSNGAVEETHRGVPTPLPFALRRDFPGFEKVAAMVSLGGAQIYVPGKGLEDEKRFKENDGLFFTEPGIFDLFDFDWLAGNATGLTAPNTGVITESMARNYFGSAEAAIGKTIEFWSFRNKVLIKGVFKDLPVNTDVPIRMGVSFASLNNMVPPDFFTSPENWKWVDENLQCFVLLQEGGSITSATAQLPGFVKKYYPIDQNTRLSMELKFQPLKNIHLNNDYGTFAGDALSVKELWSLGLIGAFLLLVACINFINLATAQSVNRAREIGVRKVLGSNRSQLIRQFLQETGLITLLALVLGILLAIVTLPLLVNLLNKQLSVHMLYHPTVLLFMAAVILVVTFLAGFYPALIVSGFKPVTIFKNKLTAKSIGGISLRRGLVVFQFVIAQLLVIGTIVVVKQMQFFRNRSMGFAKEGIALIDLPSDSSLKVKYPLLKQRMQAIAGVQDASLCWNAPATLWSAENDLYFNHDPAKLPYKITMQFGDTSYFSTFDLKLAAGRIPFHNDTAREFLVNETAVRQLGFASADAVIGKTISFDGANWFPIVGVLRDFNTRSLHVKVPPMAISNAYDLYTTLAVRMGREQMSHTLTQMQKVFREVYPTYMYDLSFFDENIERFYRTEAATAQLFKLFAILAIFISCLGLYGLVAFMAVQKTKEVGIRKVLGASVQSIVYLFSKEFTVLIVVAFLIAAPTGYYFMHAWLQDFYYHVSIGWGVFILAIVFSIVIAWITVGYKAIKAALANPVKSLKTE